MDIRDVKATLWRGDDWLIEEGLLAGERIVVDGFQRGMPGTQGKPLRVMATSPAEEGSPAGSTGTEGTE